MLGGENSIGKFRLAVKAMATEVWKYNNGYVKEACAALFLAAGFDNGVICRFSGAWAER